jgi:hypothetical protein
MAMQDSVFRRETSETVQRLPDDPSTIYNRGPAEFLPDTGDEADDDTSRLIRTRDPIIPILPDPILHSPPPTTSANYVPKRIYYLPLGPGPRIIEGDHDDIPILPRGELASESRPRHHLRPVHGPELPRPIASPLLRTDDFPIKPRDIDVHQPAYGIYMTKPKVPKPSVSPRPGKGALPLTGRDVEIHEPAYEIYMAKPKVPAALNSSLSGTHGIEPHFEARSAPKDKISLKLHDESQYGHGLPQAHQGFSQVLRRTAVQDGGSWPASSPDLTTSDVRYKAAVHDRSTHVHERDSQDNHFPATVDDTLIPLDPQTIGGTEEDEYLEQSARHIQIPYVEKLLHNLQPAKTISRRATQTLPATDGKLQARNEMAQADVYTHQPVATLYRRHHVIKPTAVPYYDEYAMDLKDNPFDGPIVPGLRGPGPVIPTSHGPFLPKNLPRDSNDDGSDEHHHSGHHSKQHNDEKSETSNKPHKDSTGNLENNDKYSHRPNGDPNSQLPAWQYQVENSVFGNVQNKREADPNHDSDRHEKDEDDRKERKNGPNVQLTVPPNLKMPATGLRPVDALWLQTEKQDKREARPIPPPDSIEEEAPLIVKDQGRMHVPMRIHHPTPEGSISNQRQKDPSEEKRALRPAHFVPLDKTSATPAPAMFHGSQDDVRRRNADYTNAATQEQDLSESVHNQRSVSRVWRHAQRDGLFFAYP